jgi:TonB family protein
MVWAPPPEAAPPKPQPLPNVIAVAQKPLLKLFTPPAPKPPAPKTPLLPDAPQVTPKLAAAAAGPNLKPLVKEFARPVDKAAPQKPLALPDAPQVAANLGAAPAGPNLRPLVKQFTPPPAARPVPESKPDAALPDAPAQVPQLAIVGLDPAKDVDIPAPPPPAPAAFSAGPKPAPTGAAADAGESALHVPDLTIRGGARDNQPTIVPRLGPPSMKTLLAGVHAVPPPLPGGPPMPRAAHVSSAPDPMLDGRVVYSIAIQMPNVTSYSGSWLVWFAERDPSAAPASLAAGEVRPPVPLRKVDPKYVASAAEEGVQGIVRLSAVIRRTGHVDSIQLLKHLDERLDASAMESLAKWVFEPAVRNGTPLDVDAVFEIPFRLAPKPSK